MTDVRVLRGKVQTIQYGGLTHLVVDDGNFNNAWRVTKFYIAPDGVHDTSLGQLDAVAVLATHAEAIPNPLLTTVIKWNWEDRRQFAWTAIELNGDTTFGTWSEGVIDPQHIVVRDMYIGLTAQFATGTRFWNYMIELERVTLSDNQAVMAIIQEESQDVN
jgi:hypothetical protein